MYDCMVKICWDDNNWRQIWADMPSLLNYKNYLDDGWIINVSALLFCLTLFFLYYLSLFGSGITLTKLVGVIVLCFSTSELFVVCAYCPWLQYLIVWSINVKSSFWAFAGVLLPDVPGLGYHWLLAWSCVSTSKSVVFGVTLQMTSFSWRHEIDFTPFPFLSFIGHTWLSSGLIINPYNHHLD